MADLFDTTPKPSTNQQRVAEALADGMTRDVAGIAAASQLDEAQVRNALQGLHQQNRVQKWPDGYWEIGQGGRKWLGEVRNG